MYKCEKIKKGHRKLIEINWNNSLNFKRVLFKFREQVPDNHKKYCK